MTGSNPSFATRLILIVLGVLGVIGWVLNIIDLFYMIGGEISTLFVLRIVGIFVGPLGSILGWFW